MSIMFVAQLGAHGLLYAIDLGPKPNPFVGWVRLSLGRRGPQLSLFSFLGT